jgi:hypothetical protein
MNIMVHRSLGTRFPLLLPVVLFYWDLGNIKNRLQDKGFCAAGPYLGLAGREIPCTLRPTAVDNADKTKGERE